MFLHCSISILSQNTTFCVEVSSCSSEIFLMLGMAYKVQIWKMNVAQQQRRLYPDINCFTISKRQSFVLFG